MKLPNVRDVDNVRDGVGIMQFTEGYWRERIAKDIEKLLDHREDYCDEYDQAIMRAAECVRFPNE